MDSLTKILEKIDQDNKTACDNILADAKLKSEEIISDARKKAEQIKSDISAKGEKQIKIISYSCGYDNPLYFSNSFKKRFGLSPKKYIEKING